ncbi:5-methylcytosine restriction system specificity protein McrC [Enterococcus sp. HY326]|uniref:5-methylcytosine restriction system specificity protein McrC n=1 Tax=Enterococcus sp. HY326 TaxID=2971265 RepID=UPI00223F5B63|nr:guanosine 5'-monophosphate oxidoreductase [Enterococcus sp. HY326]
MKANLLYDNSLVDDELSNLPVVTELLNRNVASLEKEGFITFPQILSESKDLDENNFIFQKWNGKIWTSNIVGMLSQGNQQLQIFSRFTNKTSKEDFFLRYMLQKVLNYNVINQKFSESDTESYYDLLMYLFPYYLNNALNKGIYKEYVRREYNDQNVKGTIDIYRQIKENTPFLGKIAYTTREFSHDNYLTQLVRHTIEKIQKEKSFLLQANEDTKEYIRMLRQETPSYNKNDFRKVLQKNIMKPLKHSYFEEYRALQKLCIQILSDEQAAFGMVDQKIQGIIIDIAWLWEEYIGKVTGWKHYGRNAKLFTLQLFDNPKTSPRYPDYVFNNLPIDTKYKRNLDKRNDYNQIVTYIHILNATKGCFLQPTGDKEYEKNGYQFIGKLNGNNEEVFSYYFYIPQEVKTYTEFVEKIQESEQRLTTFAEFNESEV